MLYKCFILNNPCPHHLQLFPHSPCSSHTGLFAVCQMHQPCSCIRAFSLLFPQPDMETSQILPQIFSLYTGPSCLKWPLSSLYFPALLFLPPSLSFPSVPLPSLLFLFRKETIPMLPPEEAKGLVLRQSFSHPGRYFTSCRHFFHPVKVLWSPAC